MSVSGFLGWINIRRLSILVDLPDEIYSGVQTLVTVRLTNRKHRFPSFLLNVCILGEKVPFDLIPRGDDQRNSFLYTFSERGGHVIPSGEISSSFPINFFVRSRWVSVDRRVVVFPAPARCSAPANRGRINECGALADHAKGYEGDVAKITDYTGAEPFKLIHWRLSAKHRDLKVKELSVTVQEPVILHLNAMPGNHLEERLSCAAFLVNRLIGKKTMVGLKLKNRLLPAAATREHRLRLLSELALYDKD